MDLDDRLRSNLRSRAQQISSSNVRLAQVEGRGRRRRRRRTAAAGVSLFALLAGATVGAVRLLEPEDHSDVIAAGTIEYPRADSAGDISRVADADLPASEESEFAYDLLTSRHEGLLLVRVIGPDGALSFGPEILSGDPGIVPTSGSGDLAGASFATTSAVERVDFYTSGDGTSWQEAGSVAPPAPGLTNLDRVTVSPDGTVIVSGTAVVESSAAGPSPALIGVVAATTDLQSWAWIDSYEPVATEPSSSANAVRSVTALVADADEVVAVVDEYSIIEPNVVPGEHRRSIVVYDDQGTRLSETALSTDRADLAVTPAAVALDDGFVVTGRLLPAPGTTTTSTDPPRASTGAGFVVSRDGSTWDERDLPVDRSTIIAMTQVDGRMLILLDQASDTLAATGDPFEGSWDIVRLPVDSSVHVFASNVAAGAGNVAVTLTVGPAPASAPIAIEHDGYLVSFDEETDAISLTRMADGVVIWAAIPATEVESRGLIRQESGVAVALDPETGGVVTELPRELFQLSTSETSTTPGPIVLWSPDGSRWSPIGTDSEVGFVGYGSLALTSDRLFLHSFLSVDAVAIDAPAEAPVTSPPAEAPVTSPPAEAPVTSPPAEAPVTSPLAASVGVFASPARSTQQLAVFETG